MKAAILMIHKYPRICEQILHLIPLDFAAAVVYNIVRRKGDGAWLTKMRRIRKKSLR